MSETCPPVPLNSGVYLVRTAVGCYTLTEAKVSHDMNCTNGAIGNHKICFDVQ
jgi:hypothetical protein